MMDIDVKEAAVLAEDCLKRAVSEWIWYQWFCGLVRIREFQVATKAEQPNWSNQTVALERAMLAYAVEAMEPDSQDTSELQRAVRYVRHLLGDELEKYGVEPELVRGFSRSGEALIRFKTAPSA